MNLESTRRLVRRRSKRTVRNGVRAHRLSVSKYGDKGVRCYDCRDIPLLPGEQEDPHFGPSSLSSRY